MGHEPIRLEAIAQIHGLIGRAPPPHPHVTVIAASWQPPLSVKIPIVGRTIESDLYVVSLKRGDECHVELGRQVCDGQGGTLAFLAPGQTMLPLDGTGGDHAAHGDAWTLVFHPRLLEGTPLAAAMHRYRFFGYSAREALHLTDAERDDVTRVVRQLESEASVAPDEHAGEVLAAHLQVLFSYCQRSYARQLQVRASVGGGIAEQLDRHLDAWLSRTEEARGLPTVQSCARALGYSADYLSDLLRTETGKSARGHIQRALLEAAKARLLAPAARASEVAYALGFEHPQHFTRLFRQKTGRSPSEWRRAQLAGPRPRS